MVLTFISILNRMERVEVVESMEGYNFVTLSSKWKRTLRLHPPSKPSTRPPRSYPAPIWLTAQRRGHDRRGSLQSFSHRADRRAAFDDEAEQVLRRWLRRGLPFCDRVVPFHRAIGADPSGAGFCEGRE
jgi:hypothetical protein